MNDYDYPHYESPGIADDSPAEYESDIYEDYAEWPETWSEADAWPEG